MQNLPAREGRSPSRHPPATLAEHEAPASARHEWRQGHASAIERPSADDVPVSTRTPASFVALGLETLAHTAGPGLVRDERPTRRWRGSARVAAPTISMEAARWVRTADALPMVAAHLLAGKERALLEALERPRLAAEVAELLGLETAAVDDALSALVERGLVRALTDEVPPA